MAEAAGLSIRQARAADREDLARLSTELGYPMSPAQTQARLAEIADHADHAILVAESDGRVVAWLQVSLPRIFESPRQAEIAGLIVEEGVRGRGVGRALVAEAERWSRDQGCSALRVRSNVIRERAIAFYRRAGFAEVKTQRVLEKPIA